MILKRITFISVLLSIFLFSISTSGSTASTKGWTTFENSIDTIIVNYSFAEPSVTIKEVPANWLSAAGRETFDLITMPGCESIGYVGEPSLPKRSFHVLIPQNHKIVKVEVLYEGEKVLPGFYTPWPIQKDVPLSQQEDPDFTKPDPEFYARQYPFPYEPYSNLQLQNCKGYRLAVGTLHPVRYLGITGEISYFTEAEVRILTELDKDSNKDYVSCRGLASDVKWVSKNVENPEFISYYRSEVKKSGKLVAENYPYVIITTEYLAGLSGPYNYQAFLAHKATRGYPGTIVTLTWIYANYTGNDNQDKIRNFIIDAYNSWDTEWVLLGGDGDDLGSTTVTIPPRDFYAEVQTETDYMPADMYYSCLDGSFNNDGDNKFGEPNDGVGGGEVDLYAEVHVGRACTESSTELTNFISKHIWYDTQSTTDPWINTALMAGELLWDNPVTYGCDYKDEIKDGSSANGYTTVGFASDPDWVVGTLCDEDLPSAWTANDLITIINSDTYAVMNHLGHANTSYCMRLSNSQVDNLANTKYFHGYSQGCYAGDLDNTGTDCSLEHHTVGAHGAFSFVGNARYGWGMAGSTNGASQHYDRQYFDAYFNEEIKQFGAMNSDSKADNDWKITYGANRWCCYELNLFGCPASELGGGVSSFGIISFDKSVYSYEDTATVTVQDLDLNINNEVVETTTITVTTNAGDNESILLTETGASTATFTADIEVNAGNPIPGNGKIEGNNGNTVTATYIDADDGQGGENIPRTAQAALDMIPPVISNVYVNEIGFFTAKIHWQTNENADSTVNYGETTNLDKVAYNSTATTNHSIKLTGLNPNTTYYFEVCSKDAGGLETCNNNGGSYFTFTTQGIIPDPTVPISTSSLLVFLAMILIFSLSYKYLWKEFL